jgi:glycosyltransferase involved in cell wall biosynthesis
MYILTLNYEFPPVGGGGGPVAAQIAKHLARRGHHVDVVTMRYGSLPKFETIDGVRIFRTPALRRKPDICRTYEMASYVLGAWPTILRLTKQIHYDVIHAHFLIPTGPLALAISQLTKIPYVITAHGSDVPGHNPGRFLFHHRFTGPILKSVCKHARCVTSPSLYLKNLILRNIGQYPVCHIPNGFDLNDFPVDPTAKKNNIILTVGRLLKIKGIQTLIRAVHDSPLPFEVHIAGDGPYRQELELLARGSRTPVIFHGWLEPRSSQWLDLYQKAAIFTLLSPHENASIALLEAMAAGCAVITADAAGCAETAGDAAILLPWDDDQALKKTLLQFASDPSLIRNYARKAHQRLMDYFLWDRIIDQYLEVFRLAADHGPSKS